MPTTLAEALAQVAAVEIVDHESTLATATESVLSALKTVLNGDLILGLPNLGTRALSFYGLNLSGLQHDFKIPFPAVTEDYGAPQVVLDDHGCVVQVTACRRRAYITSLGAMGTKPWFVFERVRLHTLTGSQLQRLVARLPGYLLDHVDRLKTRDADTRRAVAMAARLEAMLRGG